MSMTSPQDPSGRDTVPGFAQRFMMRTNGVGFVLAAIGLWFVPLLDALPEIHLMKLGMSTAFAAYGGGLLLRSRKRRRW